MRIWLSQMIRIIRTNKRTNKWTNKQSRHNENAKNIHGKKRGNQQMEIEVVGTHNINTQMFGDWNAQRNCNKKLKPWNGGRFDGDPMGGWSRSLRKSGMGVTGCTVSPRRWQIPCSLAPRLRRAMTSAPSHIYIIVFVLLLLLFSLSLSMLLFVVVNIVVVACVFWMKKNRESIVLTPIQLVIRSLQKRLHINKEQELNMNWLHFYLLSTLNCFLFYQMEPVWEDVTQRNDKYSMSPGWLVTNLSTKFGWEQPLNHAAILWLLSSEVTGG